MSESLQDGSSFEKLLAEMKDDPVYLGREMDELSRTAYGNGPHGLLARWNYYNLAEEPVDFHERAIKESGVEPDDTILDAGCGTGVLMLKLRENHDHKGALIGVDTNRNMFMDTKKIDEEIEPQNPISFVHTTAERLPFATDSVDKTFAMFMLYHVQDASYALHEMSRVTRPGGTVMIATSGDNNKQLHRDFEIDIANFLRIFPPRPFSAHFDSDVAEATLPLFFNNVDEAEPQTGEVVVTKETLPIYLNSLESMRDDYVPKVSDERWAKAIGTVVLPTLMLQLELNGSFRDTIDRHLYICSND